jgi:tetratricopeptide (TPR) repeat protein
MADGSRTPFQEAMPFIKAALKASSKAVHRTLNRPPKGKGWTQCMNSPAGVMCRPEGVREAIAQFEKAYAIFPDIVARYQIALHYEMIGEREAAKRNFLLVKEQAARESNAPYLQGAELGLSRLG